MAAISVRDLAEDVAARLKIRAARHGMSMEAEVRAILSEAVASGEDDQPNLAQALRESFATVDGVDLEIPPRGEMPRAVEFPERA